MANTSFVISNMNQDLEIPLKDISAAHDSLNAYINIPLTFTFRTLNDEASFDIISISAKLSFSQPSQLLADAQVPFNSTVMTRETKRGGLVKFTLSRAVMHFIENNRKGGVPLNLELNILCSIKSSISSITGRRSYVNDYLQNEVVNLSFEIAKSDWVEKHLKNSGFRNLALVEIPLLHEHLQEGYDNIIFEFQKAEGYFTAQDYNKCIAHCRNTLDALTRNLKKIKEGLHSETGFKWLETIDKETLTWIDKLNQRTSAISSKSHHAGQVNDFVRAEAESIYLVTLGLLNYVGYICKPL